MVRDLYRSERQPEQSYSERQLFEQALERMAREIAAVKKIDDDQAIKELEEYLSKNARRPAGREGRGRRAGRRSRMNHPAPRAESEGARLMPGPFSVQGLPRPGVTPPASAGRG